MRITSPARLACVLLVAAAAGCGPAQPPTYPAKGKLTHRGRPAKGAVVTLVPTGTDVKVMAHPRGEVATDGTFTLGTFAAGDGAPAGEYKLTVRWPAERAARPRTPQEAEERVGGDGPPDRLGGRYVDPAKSPWAVTIRPGDNALNPVDLPAP